MCDVGSVAIEDIFCAKAGRAFRSQDRDRDSCVGGWDPRAGPNPSLSNHVGLTSELQKTPNAVGVLEVKMCGWWGQEN
jgi:hypothetical protein